MVREVVDVKVATILGGGHGTQIVRECRPGDPVTADDKDLP